MTEKNTKFDILIEVSHLFHICDYYKIMHNITSYIIHHVANCDKLVTWIPTTNLICGCL